MYIYNVLQEGSMNVLGDKQVKIRFYAPFSISVVCATDIENRVVSTTVPGSEQIYTLHRKQEVVSTIVKGL